MRRPEYVAVVLVMTGLLAAAWTGERRPWLVYNASESAPVGFYLRSAQPAAIGDYILVRADSRLGIEAAARGLVPRGTPLVKRLVAGPGDRVCRHAARLTVNGDLVAAALGHDRAGRPLPAWSSCVRLHAGETFLLQDHPRSFDGRYHGPTPASDLAGRLVRIGSLPRLPGDRP
ncbi:MAG: S26 family signal peptidase [Rhodospirillales bacterium]|nr:S26 family signal peptidase [Rhodospirillales bacterium]